MRMKIKEFPTLFIYLMRKFQCISWREYWLCMNKHLVNKSNFRSARSSSVRMWDKRIRLVLLMFWVWIHALAKFIKDWIWKKINFWGGQFLSKDGKEVIIKSVLQSIPTYFMSIFLLPSSLEDEIQSLINCFGWGGSSTTRRGICWLS